MAEFRPPAGLSRHRADYYLFSPYSVISGPDYDISSLTPAATHLVPSSWPNTAYRVHLLGYFPGSTIGNFEPDQARAFLRRIAGVVGTGGGLLIGVDLKKDTALIEAAYNDAQGVTEA